MVAEQLRGLDITDTRMLSAMQRVPRHQFMPDGTQIVEPLADHARATLAAAGYKNVHVRTREQQTLTIGPQLLANVSQNQTSTYRGAATGQECCETTQGEKHAARETRLSPVAV